MVISPLIYGIHRSSDVPVEKAEIKKGGPAGDTLKTL